MKVPWSQSSPSKPAASEASTAREESRVVQSKREDPPRSLADGNKRELESTLEDADYRRRTDTKRELSARSEVPEHVPHETAHQRDKLSQSSESTRPTQPGHASGHATSQPPPLMYDGSYAYSSTPKHTYYDTTSVPYDYRRDVDDSYRQSSRHREHKRSDVAKPITTSPGVTPSSQTVELKRHYDGLLREYESLRAEVRAKNQRLEEKDTSIRNLTADVHTLQRMHDEQSTVLASVRHELKSCQSQLDNVQRFISTADTHADQDIIQKLQALNEEVYKLSMTMADRLTEGLTRQTKEVTHVGEGVSAVIGDVMAHYLATLKLDDDIALYLQIAFQACLSHLLYHVVSSWTIDQSLNSLIEGTYQRLRNAETQAISGRWRSLTRTHILPTAASNPNILIEHTVAGLSEVVVAAGLFSSQLDAGPKLSSEFGEKILTIVSHAGIFAGMVSEMISGDFAISIVSPGATFERDTMVDMMEDSMRPQGAREAQTVLCVSRVGLRKQMGEKTITLIKAQVVLKSFLE